MKYTESRKDQSASIDQKPWGRTLDGEPVTLFTLTNANGMTMRVTNFGGIVTSLTAPDAAGSFADVVLGYDSLDRYLVNIPYFGALIGRYGNRIAGGRFELNGRRYRLVTNNGPNTLHGGAIGFDKVVWDATTNQTENGPQITLTRVSPDGEEGFPGDLSVRVVFTLTCDNELQIDYFATTTRPTPVNLTHHSYFNLSGGERDILDHVLWIDADQFTPVDESLIPTGEIFPVEETPFDFRKPTAIGVRINADHRQLTFGGGYDHNLVLNGSTGELRKVAELSDPVSGRRMELLTEEPGLQLYSGNFLDAAIVGKGVVSGYRMGLCLETQHFPDSPNHRNFPSTILAPGEMYKSRTVYRFGVHERL